MPGLLIDMKVLIKYKLNNLLNFIGSPPKTSDDIGIVFIVSKHQYDFLHTIKKRYEQISYIRSDSFLKNIYKFYFVVYSENKKICEIRDQIDDSNHLSDIIDSLIIYLPEDITIWTGIVDINKSDIYINVGFDNPHISDKSPLNYKFSSSGIAFSKPNNLNNKIDKTTVRNKLYYTYQQLGDNCNIYSRFTPKTVKYLKHINNPQTKNQRELSGALTVSKVVKIDDKIVFELSPNPQSVKIGDVEEVDAVWSRYNFHTHPKIAYDNHGVVRGWPSSQDFVGFLSLDNETIFHTVVTLEGIYIISLSPEWKGKINSINKKYVYKHYDIDHRTKISFEQYVDDINSKKYKGKQLFVVIFLNWKNATNIFPVYYSKTNDKCLATEESFKIYKI